MIPVMMRFWMPYVSECGGNCFGEYQYPTHLFLFDGESSGDDPIDSIDNATNFTNASSTGRADGYSTDKCDDPPYDTVLTLSPANSGAYFRFNTINNAAWLRSNSWTWEVFGYPGTTGGQLITVGFGSNNHDSNGGWRLVIDSATGFIALRQPGGTNIVSSTGIVTALSSWKHYAVCFDGTYVYLCYDGVIRVKSSTALNSITSDDDLYHVGAAGGGFVTDRGFEGMDFIRIIHGDALYTGEVDDTYQIPNSCGMLNSVPA
jgi:hypothetical protein